MTKSLAAYRPLLLLLTVGLVLLALSRLLLFGLYTDRVSASGDWLTLLAWGVRADLIVLGYWLLIILLPAPLLLAKPRWWLAWSYSWVGLSLLILIAMELMTPAFIAQYDVRPNRLFIEYLGYPKEVFSTLWNGFRGWLLIAVLGIAGSAYALTRWLRQQQRRQPQQWRYLPSVCWWPLLLLVTVIGVRSTFDHRPANPAFFAITSDPLVNSLLISSTYSVQFALYNLKHEADAGAIYGSVADASMRDFVRQLPYLQQAEFTDPGQPTRHRLQPSVMRERPLNVVVIIEESMGYGFVERGLTPQLRALAEQGWWFERMYATGTRSVRGLEAVVAGFPPSPARATVKLSGAQQNFFTLAGALQEQGYHTQFVYGGEAHFDNMRSFFSGNGVTEIIDQNDYPAPRFVSSWGVSDEDLFDMAWQRIQALHQAQQPFFSLIFSSSNHEPFELPELPLAWPNPQRQHVDNAVYYADYALGQFIQQAQQSALWQDTLFLIVADHDNRVYGDSLVPIDKFHIPALILGADITPQRFQPVASQIDLLPTLLSLAGISTELPAVGQDLSNPQHAPADRALIQFNQTFALLEGDQVTLLQPEQAPLRGHYDAAQKQLTLLGPLDPEAASADRALHYALLASWLYRQKLYQQKPAEGVELAH